MVAAIRKIRIFTLGNALFLYLQNLINRVGVILIIRGVEKLLIFKMKVLINNIFGYNRSNTDFSLGGVHIKFQ